MRRDGHRLQRRLIATAAAALGLFNIVLAMFPAPLAGWGEFEDIVPADALHGSRFVLVMLGIVLMVAAPNLWRGKRVAWAIALAAAVGSAAAHPVKNVDLWGTGASVALAGALIAARRQFRARSDPPSVRRGIVMLVAGLAGVFIYSTAGLYLLDGHFRHPVPLTQALRDSFRLLFILPSTESRPHTHHGAWFVDSVRMAFLFVLALGVLRLLRPVIYRTRIGPLERQLVRQLLERYADSSIAHFALLPDKAYFFSQSGRAVLAYRAIGGTAVVMGDPIGDEGEFDGLLDQFQEHCELNGWAYAFHQATPRCLDLYRRHGLKALKIGEEGVVRLHDFSLSGHGVKHLRATMNRFEREGHRAEVLRPPHDPALLRRLRELSDEWLAQGDRRERTFTLGYFDETMLQNCDIMVARAAEGEIVAFANIIPSYRSPNGNFDMLRYGAEPKGVADFLYVSLIGEFRARGFEGMSLGLAPFSGLRAGGARSPAARAMGFLYEHGSALFRSRGLREFKEKFGPVWEPRYLVYGSDLQLPGIALAVVRAGELHRGPRWPFRRRRAPPPEGTAETKAA